MTFLVPFLARERFILRGERHPPKPGRPLFSNLSVKSGMFASVGVYSGVYGGCTYGRMYREATYLGRMGGIYTR